MIWKFWKKKNIDKDAKSEALPSDVKVCLAVGLQSDPNSIRQLTTFEPFYLQTCSGNSFCEKCGACCAFFCVSFPDIETDEIIGGIVPIGMTLRLNNSERFMKGTRAKTPRCIALEGMVGSRVRCTIYGNRPSICRNFKRSWENNIGNILCDKARAIFGLQPFSQY